MVKHSSRADSVYKVCQNTANQSSDGTLAGSSSTSSARAIGDIIANAVDLSKSDATSSTSASSGNDTSATVASATDGINSSSFATAINASTADSANASCTDQWLYYLTEQFSYSAKQVTVTSTLATPITDSYQIGVVPASVTPYTTLVCFYYLIMQPIHSDLSPVRRRTQISWQCHHNVLRVYDHHLHRRINIHPWLLTNFTSMFCPIISLRLVLVSFLVESRRITTVLRPYTIGGCLLTILPFHNYFFHRYTDVHSLLYHICRCRQATLLASHNYRRRCLQQHWYYHSKHPSTNGDN